MDQLFKNVKLIILMIMLSFLTISPAIIQAASEDINQLKAANINEVNRRVDLLNKLYPRLEKVKYLIPTDKASYTSLVKAQITVFNTFKDKINKDNALAAVQSDAQLINNGYKAFALNMPKFYIITAADTLHGVSDLLSEILQKLETKITAAKSQGKSVEQFTNAIADARRKIQDVHTKYIKAADTVRPLVASGYPANKSTLQSGYDYIKSAIADLKSARNQAKFIADGLKI